MCFTSRVYPMLHHYHFFVTRLCGSPNLLRHISTDFLYTFSYILKNPQKSISISFLPENQYLILNYAAWRKWRNGGNFRHKRHFRHISFLYFACVSTVFSFHFSVFTFHFSPFLCRRDKHSASISARA
jgi:hypothetical protein